LSTTQLLLLGLPPVFAIIGVLLAAHEWRDRHATSAKRRLGAWLGVVVFCGLALQFGWMTWQNVAKYVAR